VAQLLLTGLATAYIDNTTDDLSYASVAITLRKEMVDYLKERSENSSQSQLLVQLIVVLNQQVKVSDDPTEAISDFMDEFADVKRTCLAESWAGC
jgi:hypothetical protein